MTELKGTIGPRRRYARSTVCHSSYIRMAVKIVTVTRQLFRSLEEFRDVKPVAVAKFGPRLAGRFGP